ncbi:sulfite exporter TauE/SafE family protein [Shewanella waksmanii]|uniref:sulfite exporter TauE/SafE family protein n=1 Tax=Shewanella waksmanii TaxID=213783 RepID=UPI003736F337
MDALVVVFLSCIALGAFIGFMAGLLGIGGGIIAVPVLLYLLPSVGVTEAHLTHVAIATSLAAIILTSISSARAHHRRGNIPWHLFKVMLPGLALGAVSAGFIAQQIASQQLKQAFAVFVILMAIQMVFPFKPAKQDKPMPAPIVMFTVAAAIAIIAALMGIGGGILLVPFLTWCGLQMRQCIGFSAATGFLVALFGSVSYVIAGWQITDLPAGTLGYVYLPALIGIVSTSMLVAPIGAKAASHLPTAHLKKVFAVLLIVTGLKLVFS